jgi:hypothetical protein
VNPATILSNVRELSTQFAQERNERQRRRGLLASDFIQLKEAGFLLTAVPVEQGGIWQSVQHSTRPVSDFLRTRSHGDSSVALVCSMHPAVLSFWLALQRSLLLFRTHGKSRGVGYSRRSGRVIGGEPLPRTPAVSVILTRPRLQPALGQPVPLIW